MCSLRDAAKDLDALGVQILGASLDDVQTQKKFATDQKLDYPLLSDPDGSVAAKYGVLAGGGRFAARVTFVIDPRGTVRAVEKDVSVASHGPDLAARIRALQAE